MSDRLENLEALDVAIMAAMDGRQASLWTALPGIVQSFDAARQTCTVQPAIQARVTSSDGVVKDVSLPLLLDCPVHFPGGGGLTLTFPLSVGDEVIAIFSSRCLDAWWQSSGVQPQAELRSHDLSDAMVIPGIRSQPRRFTVSTTAAELRTDDGSMLLRMHPGSGVVTLVAPGGLVVEGDVTVTGDVVASGVSLVSHVHGGVDPGGGTTGVPQ